MILGRERTDLSRPNGEGYPVRCIRTAGLLRIRAISSPIDGRAAIGVWLSRHRCIADEELDRGACPRPLLAASMGKRPGEELYDLNKDPGCVCNIAADPANVQVRRAMRTIGERLTRHKDPRILGQGDAFESVSIPRPNPQRRYGDENAPANPAN